MVTNVFFNQSCPVCGRTLRIVVTLLGKRVYCQHCGGGFTAMDDSLRAKHTISAAEPADAVEALLERADWTLRHASGAKSGFGCEAATD